MVEYVAHKTDEIHLTREGLDIVEHGSHEARVFNAIPKDGLAIEQLSVK